MMEAKFFLFLFLVVLLGRGTEGLRHRHRRHHLPKRLFVFGDSYADTGTIWRGLADCWKPPYGSTFPGKPAGRFSDGRVIIDFVGLRSFVRSVVDQIEADLQHLVKLGVGRIGMLGLGPTGCVPMMTQNTSYSSCVDIFNHDAAYHNALLHEAVDAINTHASLRSTVAVFDMFDTLNSLVLGADKLQLGNSETHLQDMELRIHLDRAVWERPHLAAAATPIRRGNHSIKYVMIQEKQFSGTVVTQLRRLGRQFSSLFSQLNIYSLEECLIRKHEDE